MIEDYIQQWGPQFRYLASSYESAKELDAKKEREESNRNENGKERTRVRVNEDDDDDDDDGGNDDAKRREGGVEGVGVIDDGRALVSLKYMKQNKDRYTKIQRRGKKGFADRDKSNVIDISFLI